MFNFGILKTTVYAFAICTLSAGAGISHADDCEHGDDLSYYFKLNPNRVKTPIASNAQKMTTTVNGVTFTSDYDNGSLQSMTSGGTNVFNGGLFIEDSADGLGTRMYHFRFRMTGVAGRTMTINLDHTQTPRPFVRVENGPWRRMTAAEVPNSTRMLLTFGAAENSAEVAFFEPLGYQETRDEVNAILTAGVHGTSEVLGLSFQGREQWLVTVTDPTVPNAGKRRVWLHARAHAGEVTASHTMLGFLEAITANNAEGERLRRSCIFNVVPTQNVDGVALGLTRWDSQGIDPERQWGNPNRIPEVAHIYAKVNQYMAGPNPIEIGLNLHSTVGNYADSFFFKHIRPSVTLAFEEIQQRYIDDFNTVTPLFNNFSPATSQLDAVRFIESYFWNNWQAAVMAMTHEGHYYRTVTATQGVPGDYITGSHYREIGRGMAVGILDYLDLPTSADSQWMLVQ